MACISNTEKILEWVAFPFSRGSSQPRDPTQVSHLAGRFFTSWAKRKPKITGMGSLSLLQRVFPTQELNWGVLHCRWILDQLYYQGSRKLRLMNALVNILPDIQCRTWQMYEIDINFITSFNVYLETLNIFLYLFFWEEVDCWRVFKTKNVFFSRRHARPWS